MARDQPEISISRRQWSPAPHSSTEFLARAVTLSWKPRDSQLAPALVHQIVACACDSAGTRRTDAGAYRAAKEIAALMGGS